jgi:hypothetical protein
MVAAGVGVVVGGLGIVGRTVQTAVAGNSDFVSFQVAASFIGALSLVIFLAAFSARFRPGQLRARKLKMRFPSDLVLTGRVGYSVMAVLRDRVRLSQAVHPPRIPLVSFGVTANDFAVSFWGGSREPRLLETATWSEIQAVGISPTLAVGSGYPALWIKYLASDVGLHFRVASGKRFGLALARAEVVKGIAAAMETMRAAAAQSGTSASN